MEPGTHATSMKNILGTLIGRKVEIFRMTDNSAIDITVGGKTMHGGCTVISVSDHILQVKNHQRNDADEYLSIRHIRSISFFP